jgi:branched-chain amino acid transport system substrate-binding protein
VLQNERKLLKILLFFPLLLLSAAAPVYAQMVDSAQRGETEEPLIERKAVLGCFLPLSGRYKLIGEKALKGVMTAMKSANLSVEYEIRVADTGDTAKSLNDAFNQLSNVKDVAFIMGVIPDELIEDLSPRVNRAKIPTVIFPLTEDENTGGPYLIKYYYPLEEQAEVLSRYAVKDLGAKTFAVLYPRSNLGEGLKKRFIRSVKEAGGEVVYEGSYGPRSKDISEEIGWIASAKPDAVFIPDGAASSAEIISRLIREAKLRDVLFIGPSTWNSPVFLKLTREAIDGFVYRAVFTDNVFFGDSDWKQFQAVYKSEYKDGPGVLEYQVYSAVLLMTSLETRNKGDRESLMKSLSKLQNDDSFEVKKEKSGSNRISPRYRILSVSDGKLIDIMRVSGD